MNVGEYVSKNFEINYDVELSEEGLCIINKLSKKYGDEEVLICSDIACEKYSDPVTAFNKLGGILFNRSLTRKKMFVEVNGDE